MEAPTPWELQRNYEALRGDMRDGFQGMNARLDRVPTADTLTALIARLDDRVAANERHVAEVRAELQREKDSRAQDRRLVIGAILTAAGSLAVMIVSALISGVPS